MKTVERYQYIINIQYDLIEEYMKMLKDYSAISGFIHDDVMMDMITPDEANTRWELIEKSMERIVSNLHECYETIRYYKRKIADVRNKVRELNGDVK